MKKIIVLVAAWLMLASPVFADPTGANVTPGNAGSQSNAAGCVYCSSPPAPTIGQQMGLGCDANGNLMVSGTVSGSNVGGYEFQASVIPTVQNASYSAG